MFDYSLAHWMGFTAAAVLFIATPGPDMACILGQTVRGGRAAGMAACAGIWLGALGHVLAAVLGLSALLAGSPTAFAALKWAGAAYLIWMGVSALRSDGRMEVRTARQQAVPLAASFRRGLFVSLLNPKVALFFVAFLPQFVVPGQGPVPAQLALHGLLIVLTAIIMEPPMVLMADRLSHGFRANPTAGKWLDRALGVTFIGLGVKLATARLS